MSKSVTTKSVVPAGPKGCFSLPEFGVKLYLNPAESTLYQLFMAHLEGLLADELVLYMDELRGIYVHESHLGDPALQEDTLVSLCSESKSVFYSKLKMTLLSSSSGRFRLRASFKSFLYWPDRTMVLIVKIRSSDSRRKNHIWYHHHYEFPKWQPELYH